MSSYIPDPDFNPGQMMTPQEWLTWLRQNRPDNPQNWRPSPKPPYSGPDQRPTARAAAEEIPRKAAGQLENSAKQFGIERARKGCQARWQYFLVRFRPVLWAAIADRHWKSKIRLLAGLRILLWRASNRQITPQAEGELRAFAYACGFPWSMTFQAHLVRSLVEDIPLGWKRLPLHVYWSRRGLSRWLGLQEPPRPTKTLKLSRPAVRQMELVNLHARFMARHRRPPSLLELRQWLLEKRGIRVDVATVCRDLQKLQQIARTMA